MKIIKLEKVEHNRKVGKRCEYIEPNVKEDCLLESDGVIIGFYIKDVNKYSKKLGALVDIANKEFRSKNVPKSILERSALEVLKTHLSTKQLA